MVYLSFFLVSILFALPFVAQADSGCGKPLPSGVQVGKATNISIESGGLNRDYLLHVPKTYDGTTPVSLILSFHGRGKNASQQQDLSQFSNSSYNHNAIAVYPDGYMNRNGIRQWQGDPDAPATVNDVQFTIDIINEVSSRYCVDPKQIFAAGKSNGGGLVNLLACDSKASSIIAAFSPVSGAFYLQSDGKSPPCKPARSPLPIMEFHGWLDETIFYEGGENTRGNAETPPIPKWVDDWAKRDGCSAAQNSTTKLCPGKKAVMKYAWNCGGMNDAVVHYNISNLRHDWPSTYGNDDSSRTACFDATSLIMDFFQKHKLP